MNAHLDDAEGCKGSVCRVEHSRCCHLQAAPPIPQHSALHLRRKCTAPKSGTQHCIFIGSR
eukprot:1835997-Rhodomonas_salina.5